MSWENLIHRYKFSDDNKLDTSRTHTTPESTMMEQYERSPSVPEVRSTYLIQRLPSIVDGTQELDIENRELTQLNSNGNCLAIPAVMVIQRRNQLGRKHAPVIP